MISLVFMLCALLQEEAPAGRAVLVARSADRAFVVPLASVRTDGASGVATLVSVYADVGELWEPVRMDQVIEVDCRADQWRTLRETRIARDGRVTEAPDAASAYEPLPRDYPPAVGLSAVICGGEEGAGRVLEDWENRLPELRAGLR